MTRYSFILATSRHRPSAAPVRGGRRHLKAKLDRLPGAIERAGGRVTERDLNYVEDSPELFYERAGERYEIHLKRLPDPLPG
jgi:hypothetical protein